jgi:hypothetical protein
MKRETPAQRQISETGRPAAPWNRRKFEQALQNQGNEGRLPARIRRKKNCSRLTPLPPS